MRALFRLSLVLILVFSGMALGSARGQMRVAGSVVLCAGAAVTVQMVDINGRPVPVTHICPELALSLMAAVATPPVMALRGDGAGMVLDRAGDPVGQPWRIAAMPKARGPPDLG